MKGRKPFAESHLMEGAGEVKAARAITAGGGAREGIDW